MLEEVDLDIILLDQDKDKNEPLPVGADIITLGRNSVNTKDLLKKLKLSPGDIRLIEEKSIGQSNNPVWIQLRKGRVTASNFYRVHTRMESLRVNPTLSCDNLLNSMLYPKPLDHLSHIQRGRELEVTAIEELTRLLTSHGHSNLLIKDCGLFLHAEHQYLGASPDGLAICDCCNKTLLEIKCPTRDVNALPYLDAQFKLRHKTMYYGQVQGQMMVTGIKKTWFFIFYPDSTSHLELVQFDAMFCKKLCRNLINFYELYMAPTLVMKR